MKYCLFCLIIVLSSCRKDEKTIKIKGSDTEVNLAVQLAEAFHTYKSDVFVSISGGGSGLGIASLLNGTADIANSSRSIQEEEIEIFQKIIPPLTLLYLPKMPLPLWWQKTSQLTP